MSSTVYSPQQGVKTGHSKKWTWVIIHAVIELFKSNTRKKEDDMTDEEFNAELESLDLQNSPKEEFTNIPMYEAGFLKDLISGEFNGMTEKSFDNKRDQRLFKKFNSLSMPEKKAKYAALEKQIDALSSK